MYSIYLHLPCRELYCWWLIQFSMSIQCLLKSNNIPFELTFMTLFSNRLKNSSQCNKMIKVQVSVVDLMSNVQVLIVSNCRNMKYMIILYHTYCGTISGASSSQVILSRVFQVLANEARGWFWPQNATYGFVRLLTRLLLPTAYVQTNSQNWKEANKLSYNRTSWNHLII